MKRKHGVGLAVVLGFLYAFVAVGAFAGAIPQQFNYQGSLVGSTGEPFPDGQYDVEFRLWTAPSGGALVWGETYALNVVKGVFNVTLGLDGQPLLSGTGRPSNPTTATLRDAFTGGDLYLGVTALLDNPTEFLPRQQILSVPYAMNGVPVGSITAFAGQTTNVASGWLLCDGRAVSSQVYPALYQTIGTSWGNGSDDANPNTDFNLPNFKGRFPWGSKDGSMNQKGGQETVTLNANNLPPHVHSMYDYHYYDSGMSPAYATGSGDDIGTLTTNTHDTYANSTTNTPLSILPPYVTVNYLIKY